jgi:hypothetical protein
MSEPSNKPLITLPGPTPDASEVMIHDERRSDFRFPFTAAAEVLDIHSQTRIVGRSSDLGPGGCYIDTLSPFEKGAIVRVRLELELQKFEATAIVAYSNSPMGMGLIFTDIRREHQNVLNAWMAQLSGEKSFESAVTAAGPEGGIPAAVTSLRPVLNELINLLVRKKILSENEGAGLLRQMFH